MFLILGIVLFVIWIAAFVAFHVSSFLIHLLILFAIVSFIMHFVAGRRTV